MTLMSWLSRLRDRVHGTDPEDLPVFDAPLAPAERLAVIGDVHGRYDQLLELLGTLGTIDPPPGRLVFVGDLIDRGEDSARVLSLLHEIQGQLGDRMVVLRGNHEDMMLAFLASAESGQRWLRYGGLQTLASFGIGDVTEFSRDESLERARKALVEALGEARIAWLKAMPAQFTSGNVTVVHAAADPALPINDQPTRALSWGHRDFFSVPRSDGQWIVHGHTVVDEVRAEDGRIGVDTGAYATGILSGAIIDPGQVIPISVRG